MGKSRVYEIAKELNVDSKVLIDKLNELNHPVKNHMSTVSDDVSAQIKAIYQQPKQKEVSKTIEKKPSNDQKSNQTKPANDEQRKENVSKGKTNNYHNKNNNDRKKQETKPHQERSFSERGKNDQRGANEQRNNNEQRNKGAQKQNSQYKEANKGQNNNAKEQNKRSNEQRNNTKNNNRSNDRNVNQNRQGENKKPSVKNTSVKDENGNNNYQEKGKNKSDNNRGGKQNNYQSRGKNNKGKGKSNKHQETQPPKEFAEVKRNVVIEESISVQDLAYQLGKKATDVIMKLMSLGVMATINQELDVETATIIAEEFGATVEVKVTKEEELLVEIEDKPEDLVKRPPVVTIMGHVDHGKTSLLDKIRSANVTSTEAGGITQHIGAYQVEIRGEKITFLDTPGHEAFTAMRARGAQVTDIAILVVAADDGVMPQTIEAIDHAKAAQVPLIVAINKIDKPEANAERIMQELTNYGLVPEDWGGDTIMVPVSAKSGTGINELLEMILLVAEVEELKANPNRSGRGKVVESKLDKGRGPVATLLVQTGTLNVGDFLIVGTTQGRIRAMFDYRGKSLKSAPPSMPVEILGLSEVPEAGDDFIAVENERLAKQVAEKRQKDKHASEIQRNMKVSLEDIFAQIQEGEVKELNIVLKADVQGSIEAIRQSLEKISTDEVRVNIIHTAVGGIKETDVNLAAASNALIIGFNVRPDANAKKLAEKEEIEINTYRIIYEAVDDVKAALSGMLAPDIKEVVLGQAEVRETFKVPKVGLVAGCYVTDGKIPRHAKIRLIRDSVVIFDGEMASLKRFKDDVKEVASGYECGIGLERFNDIKEGDVLEAYTYEEIKREL